MTHLAQDLEVRIGNVRAGEMAQSVKWWLCKHEDPSLDPQHCGKNPGGVKREFNKEIKLLKEVQNCEGMLEVKTLVRASGECYRMLSSGHDMAAALVNMQKCSCSVRIAEDEAYQPWSTDWGSGPKPSLLAEELLGANDF